MEKSREHYRILVAGLRAKTVHNGATPHEAESARRKADEIEEKYLFIDHTSKQKTYASSEILDFHEIIMRLGFRLKTTCGIHYVYESTNFMPEYHILSWFIGHGFNHDPVTFGDVCQHRFTKDGRLFRVYGKYGEWRIDFADIYSKYHDDDAVTYDIMNLHDHDLTVGAVSVHTY